MITALVSSSNAPAAPTLAVDLISVGIGVTEMPHRTNLVQAVLRQTPDLCVLFDENPGPVLFEGISTLAAHAPCPVIVFTTDPDAEKIAQATRSGVHAYVVNGYSLNRLRSVIHLAQARFRQEQLVREELAGLSQKFEERKLVDRAKGILMGARQLREDEAYRALRNAAMDTKQRIGQVAQQVIESARYAEAINRAGQLRMLSQRLVKLYALLCVGVSADETRGLFADSLGHVDNNLAILRRSLSKATFGDLLDAVVAPWSRLRTALEAPAVAARLPEVDALAEEVLVEAERLTTNLEIAGFAAALHVINVSGRQRMLSQRLAKAALLGALLPGGTTDTAASVQTELVAGLDYLHALPLTNSAIMGELQHAMRCWGLFQDALAQASSRTGQEAIAELSETMLAHFDRLTDHIERGMQALTR